jgi:drug/metabolite transporter (DMT)-like permease
MFANPLIATLAGKIIFQERLTFQQYISIFTIVAGVVLIAL